MTDHGAEARILHQLPRCKTGAINNDGRRQLVQIPYANAAHDPDTATDDHIEQVPHEKRNVHEEDAVHEDFVPNIANTHVPLQTVRNIAKTGK